MREHLESFMLVLAIGAAVAIAAKRVGAPYNVALVVIGLLLVFADVLPGNMIVVVLAKTTDASECYSEALGVTGP